MRYKDFYQHLFERAYHGTPHDVDNFSLDKIGTGEGSSAFGWGLYFAENEKVGKMYQNVLSGLDIRYYIDGKLIDKNDYGDSEWLVIKSYAEPSLYNPDTLLNTLEDQGVSDIELKNISKYLENYKNKKITKIEESKGNLYTVNIKEEAVNTFLDWDKSLSKQSKIVQNSLNDILDSLAMKQGFDDAGGNKIKWGELNGYKTGKDLYEGLTAKLPSKKHTSMKLLENGIRGIKYLDRESRSVGKGTVNFVIFDESDVEILERNGKPVSKKIKDEIIQSSKENL